MGYRHYLYIIDKEKANNLISNKIKESESCGRCDFLESELDGQEIFELGKYSDEGFELGQNGIQVEGILAELRNAMYYEGETEFEFIEPKKLVWLAEKYLERTVKYWEKLISDEPMEISLNMVRDAGEKCIDYVKDLLNWKEFMLNTDLERKYALQTTWKYEYEMFNIIHCYKSINWNKYYLVLLGG